jgi:hypothetical protein
MCEAFEAFGAHVYLWPGIGAAFVLFEAKEVDLVVTQLDRERERLLGNATAIALHSSVPILFVGERGTPELPETVTSITSCAAIRAPFSLEKLTGTAHDLVASHHEVMRMQDETDSPVEHRR